MHKKAHQYNLGRCFFDAYLVESNWHTCRGQITTHTEVEIKLQHILQQPRLSPIRWSLFKGLTNFLRRTLLVTAPHYCNTLLHHNTATHFFSATYLLGVALRDSSDKSQLTGYESWHLICAMTVTDWFVPWLIDTYRDLFMCTMTCVYVPWLVDTCRYLMMTQVRIYWIQTQSQVQAIFYEICFLHIHIHTQTHIYTHTRTCMYVFV